MENSSLKFSVEMLKNLKFRLDVDTHSLLDSVRMVSWIQRDLFGWSSVLICVDTCPWFVSVIWKLLMNLKFLLHTPTDPLFCIDDFNILENHEYCDIWILANHPKYSKFSEYHNIFIRKKKDIYTLVTFINRLGFSIFRNFIVTSIYKN